MEVTPILRPVALPKGAIDIAKESETYTKG